MADKNEFKAFNVPLPGKKSFSTIKIKLSPVLDERNSVDTGKMSVLKNVDVQNYPYIVPIKPLREEPLFISAAPALADINGIVGQEYSVQNVYFNGRYLVFVILNQWESIMPEVWEPFVNIYVQDIKSPNGHYISSNNLTSDMYGSPDYEMSWINKRWKVNNCAISTTVNNIYDIVSSSVTTNVQFYNERINSVVTVVYDYYGKISAVTTTPKETTEPEPTVCCVNNSRIYAADNNRIYVSNFNFSGWTLDTATNINSSNAWVTLVNSQDNSDFHYICPFNEYVIAFKNEEIYAISGTKNPFRVNKVASQKSLVGTVDVINGNIYFFDGSHVKSFNGNTFTNISIKVDFAKYFNEGYEVINSYKVKDNYCLSMGKNVRSLHNYDNYSPSYVETTTSRKVVADEIKILSYNTLYELWTIIDCPINGVIIGTAWDAVVTSENKLIYNLGDKNTTTDGINDWAFCTGINYNSMGIKKIHKIQILCDIQDSASVEIYLLSDLEEFNESTSKKVYEYTHQCDLCRKIISVVPNVKTSNRTFKLYFKCSGYIKFYDMEIQATKGGDIVNE